MLRQAVALAPDQSATHRSLASAIWLKMLFLRGAVTVDHYLGSFNRARVDLAKPQPELVAEYQKAIATAIALAEARAIASSEGVRRRTTISAPPLVSTPPTSRRSKAGSSPGSAPRAAPTTSTRKSCASTPPEKTQG